MEQKIITITDKEKKLVASLRIDWEKKEIEVIENKNYNIYDGETLVQVSGKPTDGERSRLISDGNNKELKI